jgi:UDPglucose 6-dehydrogenase
MLAQRISSINSLSALCEETGANIDEVSKAIGMDSRIGSKFLKASVGFGGSCFQKDILNLVYLCNHFDLDEVAEYWHQVVKINDYQKNRFAKKIITGLNSTLKQKKITLLGWAFKANTSDSRESSAIYIADVLLEEGAELHVYDPMVKKDRIYQDLTTLWKSKHFSSSEIVSKLERCQVHSQYATALKDSFAAAILTEWEEFNTYDWKAIAEGMAQPARVFDGRNILDDSISNQLRVVKIGS